MAETESSAGSIGPIRDPNALRVCSLNGIGTKREKIATLEQLRDGIEMSIRELENERSRARALNRALTVLRFTKATCDAFIGLASALSKAILPKTAAAGAEKVEQFYGAAAPLAEAASRSVADGKVDWKTASGAIKDGTAVIIEEYGGEAGKAGYKILARSTVAKGEIIYGAMNKDEEGIKKSAASYMIDLHATLGDEAAEKMSGAGKNAMGGTAAFLKIAKSSFEYNEALGKAFDQLLDADEEDEERFRSLKANLLVQAKLLSNKIKELDDVQGLP